MADATSTQGELKHALVFGGTAGIGLAVCKLLVEKVRQAGLPFTLQLRPPPGTVLPQPPKETRPDRAVWRSRASIVTHSSIVQAARHCYGRAHAVGTRASGKLSGSTAKEW